MAQVLQVDDLPRRNFIGTKPNVYRRSMEARNFTNAYLAEVERKAAGIEEPVPAPIKRRVFKVAVVILLGVALCVGLWVL